MSLPEEVVQIPITRLRAFPEHPFYVRDDDMMQQLVESVRQVGVLMPIIVRGSEDGFYEIISGHRRKHACELLKFEYVPAIVKDVDLNEATIMMVDSNFQREVILPSEKAILDPGWKVYEDMLRDMIGVKKTEAEKMLPVLVEGQSFENPETSVTEHQTSPPKAYTEDTLLSALETAGNDCFDEDTEKKGLGTPATRAAMIEKLVANQYIRRKGKQLVPTEDGLAMAELLPEEIKSPKLTADWENALMQIEHGEASSEAFMADIGGLVRTLVSKYGTAGKVENNPFSDIARPQREQIGVCPRCGSPVYEGEKNYYCSAQGCSFCIWKESRWLSGMKKKITKKMATTLLKDGRVYVTGFYSERKGRCFDAFLVLDDTGKQVNFKLDFDGKKAARNKKKG